MRTFCQNGSVQRRLSQSTTKNLLEKDTNVAFLTEFCPGCIQLCPFFYCVDLPMKPNIRLVQQSPADCINMLQCSLTYLKHRSFTLVLSHCCAISKTRINPAAKAASVVLQSLHGANVLIVLLRMKLCFSQQQHWPCAWRELFTHWLLF